MKTEEQSSLYHYRFERLILCLTYIRSPMPKGHLFQLYIPKRVASKNAYKMFAIICLVQAQYACMDVTDLCFLVIFLLVIEIPKSICFPLRIRPLHSSSTNLAMCCLVSHLGGSMFYI